MQPQTPGPLDEFIANVQTQILEPLVTLIALAAFIVFVWGIVQFIQGADDVEKRKKGQQHILWGLVGMVIMFGANAIIGLIRATLGQ